MRISWATLALVICLVGCGGGGGGGAAGPVGTTSSATPSNMASVSSSPSPAAQTSPSPSMQPEPSVSPLPSPQTSPIPQSSPSTVFPIINLPNLSANEFALFNDGERAFADSAAGQGLGPLFNRVNCIQCHDQPMGGAFNVLVTRFGKNTGGVFDPLLNEGGPILHEQAQGVPAVPLQVLPADANVTARRRSTTTLGSGLVEAIPDSAIIAFAQTQAAQHPGQAGTVNMVTSPSDHAQHVGRFGWKCQQALLIDFAAEAFAVEIGVSNILFPIEYRSLASPLVLAPSQVDDQPDANGRRRIERAANFMRGLAPPARGTLDPNGLSLFSATGCAVCHNPSYTTVSSSAAINGQTISAYSDFLLHDIGTSDGIGQNGAPPNKMRTAPLMSVTRNPFFLHDGRAATVEDAIAQHQGEATPAQNNYNALSTQDRATLVNFVKSL